MERSFSDLRPPYQELILQIGFPRQLKTMTVPAHAEYTIYAYNRFHNNALGYNRWQRVTTIHDSEEALTQAQNLFQSHQYEKVEIKKKAFDDKKGQHVASTYRVFESRPKKDYLVMISVILLAFIAGGLFYLIHI